MRTEVRPYEMIQGDLADEETVRLAELIDSFSFSTSFIQWISNGNYSSKLVYANDQEEKFIKMQQYFIEDELVFSGRGEFHLAKASSGLSAFIRQESKPPISPSCGTPLFTKKIISRAITEPYYMIICQCFEEEKMVGTTWEFFELPSLLKFYKKKYDPLSYWKSDRRE